MYWVYFGEISGRCYIPSFWEALLYAQAVTRPYRIYKFETGEYDTGNQPKIVAQSSIVR